MPLIIKHFCASVETSDLFDETANKLGIERDEAFRRAVELFAHIYSITNEEKRGRRNPKNRFLKAFAF